MVKIYIPQAVAKEGTDFLIEQGYEIVSGNGMDLETMKKDIADCDAALVRTALYPRELIEAGKKLKIIARHGVGYDNIDLRAAEEAGIWVTNTPKALSDSVAEFTLCAILMAAKNIRNCSREMYEDNYNYKNSHKGLDLMGKTLGIVGFGRIGRAVAKRASIGLEMKILAYDPCLTKEDVPDYVRLCDWETIFAKSDIVTLHLPGGEENRNAVSMKEFKLMKKTGLIINAARGEVLDEAALKTALEKEELRGAVLDVQTSEPTKTDYILFDEDKVLLTPHMASNTEECMGRMALHAAWQIDKVLSGEEPDWAVNCLNNKCINSL